MFHTHTKQQAKFSYRSLHVLYIPEKNIDLESFISLIIHNSKIALRQLKGYNGQASNQIKFLRQF